MRTSVFFLIFFLACFSGRLQAQIANIDSAAAAKTLVQLVSICQTIEPSDPQASELGPFYNAAPLIAYHGADRSRTWKDVSNYKNALEKAAVDEICTRINNTLNQDSSYKILKYFTETTAEGTWYVLVTACTVNGERRQAAYAFLKINGHFALGEIH